MQKLVARAPAKVNLTLRVLRRRADGFHDLASLVSFAGAADLLSLAPDAALDLEVSGPTAPAAGPQGENLVLRAAHALRERVSGLRLGRFHLVKRLPVAAGIGGGSSDAAAALRLLAQLNGLDLADPRLMEAARVVGSDVPVCLSPRARMMRGVGDQLSPPLDLPPLPAVLVNCRVAVPTAPVFRALGLQPGEELPGGPHAEMVPAGSAALLDFLARTPNDLEPPAQMVAPQIGSVKAVLQSDPRARFVRMSGSGATVFALTDTCRDAAGLAKAVSATHPDWWVRPTVLR
ncbi:4-(cytidine 5'-diphospho)-2-C-methyl-D-erythritol kinase [Roseixanthobacter pseudopolyaromaticivorans]|uniref:4-(cytidine 5'-diphospho)-2-C-methyl-D-erythritol kinase n=1 Tax=Xanthobacteraceae TaxID=335928 RepID=UPI00372C1F96